MDIVIKPIAIVTNNRKKPIDDYWGVTISEITMLDHVPTEALDNIGDFSHLEVIYYFNQVDPDKIIYSGHPRNNKAYPLTGIFAQRKKNRPNRLGLSTVEILGHTGRSITVKHFDAIDGTPILDIKPVFKEFEPEGEIKQPAWVADVMKDYWK